MKIIAIGDTHGRKLWWDIVSREADADLFLFIGDYFDTKEGIAPIRQMENFTDLLEFRNEHPEKVVLLTGNHDYHYLPCCKQSGSGKEYAFEDAIRELVEPAWKSGVLQMAWQHEDYLFTHAGLTTTWCEDHNVMARWACKDLNRMFLHLPESFNFTKGPNQSVSGDDVTQGPLWVRPKSLIADALPGYTHVVGHTQVKEITYHHGHYFIDALGHSRQYFILEEGEARVGNF
jgi:hypothetical protein